MAYSIQLKDGTTIPGIPDNIDPSVISKQYYEDKKANAPEEGVGTFAAGAGRGVTNVARNLGNLVGAVSDEDLQESERLDQPLMDTTSGMAGSIAGEIAATALPGMAAVRGGAKGLGLARAIAANPIKSAVAGGAGSGYLSSTPSTRESSLAAGAVGGGLGYGLGRAVSKMAKGATKKEGLDQFMIETGEDFLPASIAAEEGTMLSRLYKEIGPSLPGGKGLIDQSSKAFSRWNRQLMEKAVPEGQVVNFGDDALENMSELNRVWQDAGEQLEAAGQFKIGNKPKLFNLIFGKNKVPDQTMKDFADKVTGQRMKGGEVVDGSMTIKDVLEMRRHLLARAAKKNDSPIDYTRQIKRINDAMDETFSAEQVTKPVGKLFRSMRDAEDAYKIVRDSSSRATKRGSSAGFTPEDVARESAKRTQEPYASAAEGVLQKESLDATRILGKKLEVPSMWRWLATVGLMGVGSLGGPLGSIGALAGGAALTKVLKSTNFQKALLGDFGAQKAVANVIKNNPEAARALQAAIVAASGSQAGE